MVNNKTRKLPSADDFGDLKIFKTLFLGLFVVTVLSIGNNIRSENQDGEQAKSSPSIQGISAINTQTTKTSAPSTTPNMPIKKVAQPSPSPASDYVKCNISAKCGGGYKEMLKSTCDEMVCCTYSLDYPPMFTSRSDCETRIKQYDKPALTPYWENQYSPAPSVSTSTQNTNSELQEQQIKDCLARWDRLMYDTMSLCAVHNGVQDSYCLSQAQESAGREKASCRNL